MRLFEFQFNPDKKNELIFDSFCFVPENIYEKRMGGIFMVGELKNPLPHNYKLLEKTAQTIKKEFYSKFQRNHEQALKESLKRGNEFLAQEVSKENTDWLGNMNFAIISLKNFELNFTKVGGIKMFLIRGPHIIDIGSKLDSQEIEPYPLKIFNNIVSGKLGENDTLLVFSENIFPELKNLINNFSETQDFDGKKITEILKAKEEELTKISGTFILINLSKDQSFVKRPKIIFQKEKEKMTAGQLMAPIKKYSQKAVSLLKNLPKIKFPSFVKKPDPKPTEPTIINGPIKVKVRVENKKTELKPEEIKTPGFRLPNIKLNFKLPAIPQFNFSKFKNNEIFKKRVVLVALLMFFLASGFLIFQTQENKKQKEYLANIKIIEEKVLQAESFMSFEDSDPQAKNQALSLLSLAWSEIIPLTKLDGQAKKEAVLLKNKIDSDLKNLNNSVKIDDPELIFKFNKEIFIPQKLVYDEENLYFISQYVQNIFSLNKNGNGQLIQKKLKFNEASEVFANYVLLLTKPKEITVLEAGQPEKTFSLELLSTDFEVDELASFKENFYLLDANSGEIAKYFLPLAEGINVPQKWFWSKTALRPNDGKSLAVDGFLWVLDKNNKLLKYYGGQLQETILPDVFPAPENFAKIIIPYGSPYIFISEPAQKRLVILDKQGKIFKQYESPKFDAILDFAVSQDGQTVFLLNGLSVYKIIIQ